MIADITKDNGILYMYDELMNMDRLQIRVMDYACLIDAIPKVWKDLLKEHPVSKYRFNMENGPVFKVDGNYIKRKDAKCKELNWYFIRN